MNCILKAENISRTYGKGHTAVEALKPCTLEFEKGEFAAVVGKSGSGKSTLLRILGAQDLPDSGTIRIDGETITGWSDEKLSELRRRKIGFVYQTYDLFPEFTAYENIVLPIRLDGRTEDRAEVEDYIEQLGILELKDRFPQELSGGEQQRVSIARAFAMKPAVILADEPTGNLDAESAREVAQMLTKASRFYEQTIIMVTHDRQMAEYADRIIGISDGYIMKQNV